MAPSEVLLFVYGTLRPGSTQIMSRVLGYHARHLGPATVTGLLYNLGEYPGAVPSMNVDDIIHGDLFRLNHPQILLELLDNYEGCGDRCGVPHLFQRQEVTARQADGSERQAWIYWYCGDLAFCELIPGGDYVASLEDPVCSDHEEPIASLLSPFFKTDR